MALGGNTSPASLKDHPRDGYKLLTVMQHERVQVETGLVETRVFQAE